MLPSSHPSPEDQGDVDQPALVSPHFDRLLFQSEHLCVGSFRAPAEHHRFQNSGPAPAHLLVFPRTAVAIQHEGARSFVVGPPIFTAYNAGQRYRRSKVSPEGDHCEWFALSSRFTSELMSSLDPRHEGNPARPFAFSHGPCPNAVYLAQRRFTQTCLAGHTPSTLQAEEFALSLACSLISTTLATAGVQTQPRAQRQRDCVEHAKLLLLDGGRDVSVSELATLVGCSSFHLCRSFRRITGLSLHGFREQVRLRRALNMLEGHCNDLTELALDLGYASHSHFTQAFHQTFGLTPRAYRRRNADAVPTVPAWRMFNGAHDRSW